MMRIGMLSGHGCVRVQKMALPRAHEVHMIAKAPPTYHEQYTSFTIAPSIKHYVEWINRMKDEVDIFHAHNEPSWFITAIKERCDVPVILDVHDSYLARVTPEEEEKSDTPRIWAGERNNFQLADGLVFPGRSFSELIIEEFNLLQPSLILPSYLPRFMYGYVCGQWMGGLVYEGKVMLTKECTEGTPNHGFRYCDYEELTRQAHELGIDFHLYGIRKDEAFGEAYKNTVIHQGRSIDELIKALTRHDWGLIGNVFPTPEWDVAFPNKLFEYIAASVPVVVMNASDCRDFVLEHGVGIAVDSLQELADRWSEHTEVRKNLIKVRQRFAMENFIGNLEDLYAEVIG
jgi:glycosyltransferase involved in cell wall biosynthesis